MISLSFLNRLLTAAFITILLIVSGCGILPDGPDKKSNPQPSFNVQIDLADGPDGYGLYQARIWDVNITTTCESGRLDGFDLLLAYEPEALSLIDINPGDYFQHGDWEYFDYELLIDTLESDGSKIFLINITAALDSKTIIAQKSTADSLPKSITIMRFWITADRTFDCHHSPLRFYWRDCDDNRLYKHGNDGSAVSVLSPFMTELDADSLPDPGWHGPAHSCFSPQEAGELTPVKFINGGIDIICSRPIDPRTGTGDINDNEIFNEIADAVMFTNFFMVGLDAFGDHVEESIKASDLNGDGLKLSVADLVYLIRIIIGDALPYHHMQPGEIIHLTTREIDNELIVDYESESAIGAVWLEFLIDGEITGSLKRADNLDGMDIDDNTIGDTLRVLIFNIGPNAIPAGTGELLRIPVDGSLTLIQADAGDYLGARMTVIIGPPLIDIPLPDSLFPPFYFPTDIKFTMPKSGKWTTIIYNVLADPIREYSGRGKKGREITIEWDGFSDEGVKQPAGAYFFRVSAKRWIFTGAFIHLDQ